jgi:hypothetical protein
VALRSGVLSHLLRDGGFSDCVERHLRQGEIPDLERLENRPDSIFVEAARDAATSGA